jgi:hypothetical protein
MATAVLGFAGLAGSSAALATETLSFVPQAGKFPYRMSVSGPGEWSFAQSGGGPIITCTGTASNSKLEITGHKTALLTVGMTLCATNINHWHTSNTKNSSEILIEKVPVDLVYVSKEHHEAALDLNYYKPGGAIPLLFHAENETGSTGWYIRNSVVAAITSVNKAEEAFSVKLATGTGLKISEQIPKAYETEAGMRFTAFPEESLVSAENYFEAGVSHKMELKSDPGEGKLEIKA